VVVHATPKPFSRAWSKVTTISLDILRTMPVKAYAGIGSRETPPDVLAIMRRLARLLGSLGFTLRTGGADGADTAFENGAAKVELYLPWPSFNGRSGSGFLSQPSNKARSIAEQHHPRWYALDHATKKLIARNTHQVLGATCGAPSAFLLC
jgi:hypothetical protein